MKAWVIKLGEKYACDMGDKYGCLNEAMLLSTKKAALEEGLITFTFPKDLPKVKAVKVEIKEVK